MTVNNHAQYCSVVKTGIGRVRMIIGGEVDARECEVLKNRFLKPDLTKIQSGIVSQSTRKFP